MPHWTVGSVIRMEAGEKAVSIASKCCCLLSQSMFLGILRPLDLDVLRVPALGVQHDF